MQETERQEGNKVGAVGAKDTLFGGGGGCKQGCGEKKITQDKDDKQVRTEQGFCGHAKELAMLKNLDIFWEEMDILKQEIMIYSLEVSFGWKKDF